MRRLLLPSLLMAALLWPAACTRKKPGASRPPRDKAVDKRVAARPAQRFVDLAVGRRHACAVRQSGEAVCWGSNADGQLGRPADAGTAHPVRLPVSGKVVQIAVSNDTTSARLASGKVVCFGNQRRCLNGITDAIDVDRACVVRRSGRAQCPVTNLKEMAGVRELAVASGHACARLASGAIACIGDNRYGQVGLKLRRRSDPKLRARQVQPGVRGIKKAIGVTVGTDHSCAALAGGGVRCWGYGAHAVSHKYRPQLATAVEVAAGGHTTCARLRDGTVRCWGTNYSGQIGSPEWQTSALATPKIQGVTRIAVAPKRSCAIRRGEVWCWGDSQRPVTEPGRVALEHVTAVAAAHYRTCALVRGGALYCWGKFSRGVRPEFWTKPRKLRGGVAAMAVGMTQVCAVAQGTGAVECFGSDQRFQPVGVTGATQIALGSSHGCALAQDGRVWCWGSNYDGALGDGTTTSRPRGAPVVGLNDAVQIAAGVFFTCARRRGGGVVCWGDSAQGKLGVATKTDALRPQPVPGIADVVELRAGNGGGCVRQQGGAVKCWGLVAGGLATLTAGPTALEALRGATRIGMGDGFVCGVIGGRARCYAPWSKPELGLRPATGKSYAPAPTTGVTAIAGGDSHVCLLAVGKLSCYGSNERGELGLGFGHHVPRLVAR